VSDFCAHCKNKAPAIIFDFLPLGVGVGSWQMIAVQTTVVAAYFCLAFAVLAGTAFSFLVCYRHRVLWLPFVAAFAMWFFFFDGWLLLMLQYGGE
jgi:hypothetical protein